MANISGSVSDSLAGGKDLSVVSSLRGGGKDLNGAIGAFGAGNTTALASGAPPTVGVFAGVNSHGHGVSIEHSTTPGVQSTLKETARINLLDNGVNRVDATAYHSQTHLKKADFMFNKVGGSIDYSHVKGHGASVGVNHIPNIGSTLDVTGRANLWTSPDKLTTFDAATMATRGLSGHFAGQKSFGAGLGFTHRF